MRDPKNIFKKTTSLRDPLKSIFKKFIFKKMYLSGGSLKSMLKNPRHWGTLGKLFF